MLTDPACKQSTCPADRPRVRLADAGGLYLEVTPNGSRRWFVKYRFEGKEKRLALGSYPEVSLKAAREGREAARKIREAGTDPVQARQMEKAATAASNATTFEAVAREFHQSNTGGWSPTHAAKWLRAMEKDVFPRIGSLPLASITAPVLLGVLHRVEARGAAETARKISEAMGQVFRRGMVTGRCERNPAERLASELRPTTVKHMAAVLEPLKVGELLRAIEGYAGQPVTRAALALSALLFQRPGNVRMMEWSEIDLDAALWSIPAVKMKRTVHGKVNGRPHLVPLSAQALALLKDLQPLTGTGLYVFPSLMTGDRPMSDNTLRSALRRMGYTNDEMTPHGFRAMARTLIIERLPGISPDVIEAQLAHGKSGPLGMAYDRAEFMEQRRQMMQTWADYLDKLRVGAQVIPFKAA